MAGVRCLNCRSLVSLDETAGPSVSNEKFYQAAGVYSATIRIANQCARCGNELQEQFFFISHPFSLITDHPCPEANTGVGWRARMVEVERLLEMVPPNKKIQKKFHIVYFKINLKCNCGQVNHFYEDRVKVAASDMVTV